MDNNSRNNNNNNTSPKPTIRQQLLFTPTPPTSASKQNQPQPFNDKNNSKKKNIPQKDFLLDDVEYFDDDNKYPSIPRVSSGRAFATDFRKKETSPQQQQMQQNSLVTKSSNVNLQQLLRHQPGMSSGGHLLSSGNLFHNNNNKKEIPVLLVDPYNGMTRAKFNLRKWRVCGKAVLAAIRLVYFGERCLGPHDKELVEAIYYKHLSSTNASSNTHLSLLLTPDLHRNHNLGNHLNNNNNNSNLATATTTAMTSTFIPNSPSSPPVVSSSSSSPALQNGRNPNNTQLYSENGLNINNNISHLLFQPSDQQNNNNNNSPRLLMNQNNQLNNNNNNTSSIFEDLSFSEAKTLLLQKCGSNAGPIDSEHKLVQFLRTEFGFVGIVEEEEQRALVKSSDNNNNNNNCNEKKSNAFSSSFSINTNNNNNKDIHHESANCGTTLKQLLGYEIKTWPVRLCVLYQIVAQLTKQQEWIQQVMASKNPNLGINSVPLGNLLFDQLSVEISRDEAKSMRRKRRHEQQHQGINTNNNIITNVNVVVGGGVSSPPNEQNGNISHQWMKEHPVMLPSSSSDSSGSEDENDRFYYHYNEIGNPQQQQISATQVTNSGTFSPSSPTQQQQPQSPEKKKTKLFKSILRRVDATFLVQILQLFQFPADVVELFKMRAASHPWLTRKALVQILEDPLANAASVAKLSALTQSISLSAIQARRAKDRIQDASSALVSALWKKLGNHGNNNNPSNNNNMMNQKDTTTSFSADDAERAFAALFDTNNSSASNYSRNRSTSMKKTANNVNASFFGASILKSAAPGSLATMGPHHHNLNPKPQVAMGFSFVANIRANEESRKQLPPNQNGEIASTAFTKKVDFSKARTGRNNDENKIKETIHLGPEPSSSTQKKEIDQTSKTKVVALNASTTNSSTLDRETWKKKMDSIFGDARPPPRKMMAEFRFVELSTPRRHQQQIKTTDSSETVGFTTSEQRWWLRGVGNNTNLNNTSDSGRNSPNANNYHKNNNNHITRKDIFANYSPTKKDKSSRPTSGRLRRKSSNSVSRRASVATTTTAGNNINSNNAANATSSPSYLRPTSAASSKSLPSLANNNHNNNRNPDGTNTIINNDINANEKPPWHVSSGRTEGAPNPPLPLPGTPRRERDREGKKLPPPRPKWSMVNPFVDGKAWDDV